MTKVKKRGIKTVISAIMLLLLIISINAKAGTGEVLILNIYI